MVVRIRRWRVGLLTGGGQLGLGVLGFQFESRSAWLIILPLIAALSVWAWTAMFRRYRAVGDTPTSQVASAAQGYVELSGRAQYPPEVKTLFAVASLRVTCRVHGVEEVSTYRDQVRVRPVELPDVLRLDLMERVPGATFHEAKRTLNLTPERIAGTELPGWVEDRLREALGDTVSIGEEVRR